MSLPIKKWKESKSFEQEARRVVTSHVDRLAKNKALQETVLVVEYCPPISLFCLLFPWHPLCRWRDFHWYFPWLCWHSWWHPIPPIIYPPEIYKDVIRDPVVMIDTIVQYLPDKELSDITERDVLNAAVKVNETKFEIIGKSMERITEGMKKIIL